MSGAKNKAPAPAASSSPPATPVSRLRLTTPDGAELKGPMRLTGVVRTRKLVNGQMTDCFAVAVAQVGLDGSLEVKLGNSQVYPEFVHVEHKKMIGRTS